jgi:hypothetical protein
MHGVGLLRISRTPVTVDTEEYVVFVNGRLSPYGFASWKEANASFVELVKLKEQAPQEPLRSGFSRKKGARPGGRTYLKAVKEQEDSKGRL